MRRTVLLAAALLMLVTPHSASAHRHPIRITHNAYVPCAFACPYWDHVDLDRTCNDLANPASYDQTSFAWTDDESPFVYVENFSTLDWDMVACTDTVPSHRIEIFNPYPYQCYFLMGRLPLTCREGDAFTPQHVLEASDGETDRFFIRSFMWLDATKTSLTVEGSVVVADDSFEWLPVAHPL